MAAPKLKPVEANDGSYAGLVLAAFDALPPPAQTPEIIPGRDGYRVLVGDTAGEFRTWDEACEAVRQAERLAAHHQCAGVV